jgi:hypothetical protein
MAPFLSSSFVMTSMCIKKTLFLAHTPWNDGTARTVADKRSNDHFVYCFAFSPPAHFRNSSCRGCLSIDISTDVNKAYGIHINIPPTDADVCALDWPKAGDMFHVVRISMRGPWQAVDQSNVNRISIGHK